jgi:hypothetical protein
MQQKLYNWNTLNNKVLKKLGMQLTKQHMSEIANVTPGAIERALKLLKIRLAGYTEESYSAGSPLRWVGERRQQWLLQSCRQECQSGLWRGPQQRQVGRFTQQSTAAGSPPTATLRWAGVWQLCGAANIAATCASCMLTQCPGQTRGTQSPAADCWDSQPIPATEPAGHSLAAFAC